MKTTVVLVALGLLTTGAVAQTSAAQLFGVLCYTEEAVVKSATAFDEGGTGLQDEVLDHMINVTGECVRIAEADALEGYFVYSGPVIGSKRVVGIGPTPNGAALLFGLLQADDPGPPPMAPDPLPSQGDA